MGPPLYLLHVGVGRQRTCLTLPRPLLLGPQIHSLTFLLPKLAQGPRLYFSHPYLLVLGESDNVNLTACFIDSHGASGRVTGTDTGMGIRPWLVS